PQGAAAVGRDLRQRRSAPGGAAGLQVPVQRVLDCCPPQLPYPVGGPRLAQAGRARTRGVGRMTCESTTVAAGGWGPSLRAFAGRAEATLGASPCGGHPVGARGRAARPEGTAGALPARRARAIPRPPSASQARPATRRLDAS